MSTDRAAATPRASTNVSSRLMIPLALAAVYLIWGSTYLAMRFGLQGFPPFLMLGVRFLIAGGFLYIVLRLRGWPPPTRRQWLGALPVGILLLVGGNGGVAFSMQWVASGLAALSIASVPLWTVLFAGLWGRWPTRSEVLGLGIGFVGIVLLNLEGDLRAHPVAALGLLVAAVSWSFGSEWSRRLELAPGLMASATLMLVGGISLSLMQLAFGEPLEGLPTGAALGGLAYLIVFGSLIGFSAYGYLLQHVRPAVATSYAYVNPVVAMFLGWALAAEPITLRTLLAAAIILTAVVLINTSRVQRYAPVRRESAPSAAGSAGQKADAAPAQELTAGVVAENPSPEATSSQGRSTPSKEASGNVR